MFTKVLPALFISLAALALSGCSGSVSNRAAPTKFTGNITGADGKPLRDVTLQFLPQFLGSIQTATKVGADGKFEVELLPGKYVFMVEPVRGKEASFKTVAAKYHNADKANEMDVVAGSEIVIKLTN